jgi:hypothetical protein
MNRRSAESATSNVSGRDHPAQTARLLKIVPLSQEMVLDDLGSHVLGLPRSY